MKCTTLLLAAGLFSYTAAIAQEPVKPAQEILKEARQQAAMEHKKVFVIFHASWCGWCHRMDSLMNNPVCKKMFTDNYVIRHLVILESPNKKNLENPGAEELIKKYHGDNGGIPFWLIFDDKGTLLADSKIRPDGAGLDAEGKNMGCPTEKEEVAIFVNVLRKTSLLKQDQLDVIGNLFSAKK